MRWCIWQLRSKPGTHHPSPFLSCISSPYGLYLKVCVCIWLLLMTCRQAMFISWVTAKASQWGHFYIVAIVRTGTVRHTDHITFTPKLRVSFASCSGNIQADSRAIFLLTISCPFSIYTDSLPSECSQSVLLLSLPRAFLGLFSHGIPQRVLPTASI